MLKFAFAAILFGSTASFALPAGHWQGNGEWTTNDSQSAPFQYELTITSDTIAGFWTYEGHNVPYSLRFRENGKFFSISSGNSIVGQGYCYGVQCHYSAVIPDEGEIEETLTFQGKKLYSLGSKNYQGHRVIWTAALTGN